MLGGMSLKTKNEGHRRRELEEKREFYWKIRT